MDRKTFVKNKLTPYPRIKRLASLVWWNRRPAALARLIRDEGSRIYCYRQFQRGNRRITKRYGHYCCEYEAISPKNYFELSISSRYEDSFMSQLFSDRVRNGMVVLDIGGHTGMYSVPFAKHVGQTGKVFVFEPETSGVAAIKRNIELNDLQNVTVLKMALSDQKGRGLFYVRPDKDTHSLFEQTLAPSPSGIQEVHEVEMSTVDALVTERVIPPPDFIKIDTEGAELKILDGMKHSAKDIKDVLVEIHAEQLQAQGIGNANALVEGKLAMLGFTHRRYLDWFHILASKE